MVRRQERIAQAKIESAARIAAFKAQLDAKAQAERERDTFALCLDDDYLKTERAQLKADLIAERTAHAQTRAVMREHAATCRRIAARMEANGQYAGWLTLMAGRLEAGEAPQTVQALAGATEDQP